MRPAVLHTCEIGGDVLVSVTGLRLTRPPRECASLYRNSGFPLSWLPQPRLPSAWLTGEGKK